MSLSTSLPKPRRSRPSTLAAARAWAPSTGGIYPLLKKLEKDGLVIGKWDDPKKKFQKIYYLTDLGEKEFQHRRHLLKPRIEESLKVFQMVYKDLYL